METDYREIVILRGIPASGKSTYANDLVTKGWKRINKDTIRLMINDYSLDNSDENLIHKIQSDILKRLMRSGRNIVIDNTHTKQKYLDDLTDEIWNNQQEMTHDKISFDYGVLIKVIDVTLEEALKRNNLRQRKVMEEVIKRMHNQLHSTDMKDKFFMVKDI